ncbi:MAG: hypothetical protein K2J70_05760, partial [Muribaculaceae bacterium]|nr:hypothetical protein [Muribaculaceae bacterium]
SELKADSMKRLLQKAAPSLGRRITLMEEISKYYSPRMADSALTYAYRAHSLAKENGQDELIDRTALTLTNALSASGYFSAAVTIFDSVAKKNLSHDDRLSYWYIGRQLYSNICNYVGETGRLYDIYFEKENVFVDSLIRFLPEGNDFKVFLKAQVLINAGKEEAARKELLKVLQRCTKGSQIYGMTAYQISQSYQKTDQTRYAAYLAMASESDIIGGIRDGFALPSLSDWLYREKEYATAFKYINFAMNDAYLGSARMRLVNISSFVPDIDEAYRNEINSSLSDFAIYALMVSVILIILIIVLALLLKEMRKRRLAHTQLVSVSKMKDSYIRDFIGLCSAYSEKYDVLAQTVMRKIQAGQSQDLLKLVKSGKASESENEEFYKTIDRVFASLYPNFIEQINELLIPEERYSMDNGGASALNPELRIYGFVRLGVTESSKIAKILNYSSNTVYTYRNRMRNKALNRETFDDDVLNLDSGIQE